MRWRWSRPCLPRFLRRGGKRHQSSTDECPSHQEGGPDGSGPSPSMPSGESRSSGDMTMQVAMRRRDARRASSSASTVALDHSGLGCDLHDGSSSRYYHARGTARILDGESSSIRTTWLGEVECSRHMNTRDDDVWVWDEQSNEHGTCLGDSGVEPTAAGVDAKRESLERQAQGTSACCGISDISVGTNASGGTHEKSAELKQSQPAQMSDEAQQLIAELSDYMLERGALEDRRQATGAARVCLDLLRLTMSSGIRAGTESAASVVGPADLASLADIHLDISSSCSQDSLARLLTWLISGNSDSDECFASHRRLKSKSPAKRIGANRKNFVRNVEHEGITSLSQKDVEVVKVATAGVEAALIEAFRVWQDIIAVFEAPILEAAGWNSGKDTNLAQAHGKQVALGSIATPTLKEGGRVLPCHMDVSLSSSLRTRISCGGAAQGNTGEADEPVTVTSDRLQQAVRVVTTEAASCYGQLVVLGHKEFTVRDSTWYPVGPTNECFLLSKRDSSNGVQLASNIVGDQYRPECQENPEVERGISPTDVKVDVDATSPIATISQGGQALETFKTPESQPVNLTERAKVTVGAPARARFYGGAGGVEGGSIMDFIRQENSESGDFARPLPHRIFLLLSEAQRREALAAEAALSMEARAIDDLRLPSVTYTLKRQSPPRGVIGAGREGAIGESMPLTTVTPAATPAATPAPAGVHGEGSPVRPASTDVVGLMCHEDPWTDMFQLGRMEGPENDFVVRGPLHQSGPGNKVCGPVSRYAVRLLVDRDPPHRCRIFTGGFNSRKFMALPKACPKWRTMDGSWDAVTAFGVRILKPEIGEWREVSVSGAMHRPRVHRLDQIGESMPDETNELTTGTIIDFGGVQMLYESVESMVRPGGVHPSRAIEALDRLKPQCPVQLQPLKFKPWNPRRRRQRQRQSGISSGEGEVKGERDRQRMLATEAAESAADLFPSSSGSLGCTEEDHESKDPALVPHIFPACGHVHGYAPQLHWGPCPMCRTRGPLVEMAFAWCSAIDREMPEVVFNPCGHVASREVAERWASTPMPNNAPPDAVYRPVCPYCAQPLSSSKGDKPYNKIVFLQ